MPQLWSWAKLGLELADSVLDRLSEAFELSTVSPFIFRMKYQPRDQWDFFTGFDSTSGVWQQVKDADRFHDLRTKNIKPHIKYLFSFWRSLHWLVISFKLGKFGKKVRLLVTFLQPSSYILHYVADRFCSTLQPWLQSALNYILCSLPGSKDFLQQSVVPCVLVKSQVGGSRHAERCSKDFEGNIFWREIKINIFQEEDWFCVLIVILKVFQGIFLINKSELIILALEADFDCLQLMLCYKMLKYYTDDWGKDVTRTEEKQNFPFHSEQQLSSFSIKTSEYFLPSKAELFQPHIPL